MYNKHRRIAIIPIFFVARRRKVHGAIRRKKRFPKIGVLPNERMNENLLLLLLLLLERDIT